MNKFNIEDILTKTDLTELVRKAGGMVDSAGRCACPLHGGENDTAFSIFQKDGKDYWKCWTGYCGGGDAIDFVKVWQGMDFKAACEFLGGDVVSDPVAMEASAKARLDRAKVEHEEARLRMEARRAELQVAQLHLHYHETMRDWARLEWVRRGLDESYQGLWMLGSCDDKVLKFKGEEYHTPTLTIPLVDEKYNLLNIKHRLINPPKPNDKYRPEREGLGTFPPFIAFPDVGYNAEVIWVMEGEIKAMVTATISPDSSWQFIGVPGQDAYEKLPDDLFSGKKVIVVPDPKAELKAWKFAKKIGARFLMTPEKIDDLIVENGYDQNWLYSMSLQARKG
jgi:hypothetical protein